MSWAINYTYVIDVMRLGNAYRCVSPVSPGYGAAYNASAVAFAPFYNITKAREIMVSMGFGDMGWTDAQWIAVTPPARVGGQLGGSPVRGYVDLLRPYETGRRRWQQSFLQFDPVP